MRSLERKGNAFYENYLCTNFKDKYSKLKLERKESEKKFDRIREEDPNWADTLPF